MTTQRTYKCNLCRDNIDVDTKNGVGVYFTHSPYIAFKMVRDAEHHLCNRCIDGVIEAHRQVNDRPQDKL